MCWLAPQSKQHDVKLGGLSDRKYKLHSNQKRRICGTTYGSQQYQGRQHFTFIKRVFSVLCLLTDTVTGLRNTDSQQLLTKSVESVVL